MVDRQEPRGRLRHAALDAVDHEVLVALVLDRDAERGDAVLVYDLSRDEEPRLLQVLPVGDAPEGLLALERRGLFIASNEDDGTLSVFGLARR